MNRTLYNRLLRKVMRKLRAAHWPAVAEESEMPYSTVYKIASGISQPKHENLTRLADHFGITE